MELDQEAKGPLTHPSIYENNILDISLMSTASDPHEQDVHIMSTSAEQIPQSIVHDIVNTTLERIQDVNNGQKHDLNRRSKTRTRNNSIFI
jgi:hypothetical protein